jgi:hypothetical protein
MLDTEIKTKIEQLQAPARSGRRQSVKVHGHNKKLQSFLAISLEAASTIGQ